MSRSRLRPGNDCQRNEAGRSIFTFLFHFVLVNTKKYPKQSQFLKLYVWFETSLSYCHLTYRPRFDGAWKALGTACI